MELSLLSGRRTSISLSDIKEFRRSRIGLTTIRSSSGGRFVILVSAADIYQLIGVLRETSDARIVGFENLE